MDHRTIPCTTRAEHSRRQTGARRRGERLFYGMPCARCGPEDPGDGLRLSACGRCAPCRRRAQAQQAKRWRKEHPEQARAHLRRHLVKLGSRRRGPMIE